MSSRRQELRESIQSHLRHTARQIIHFDTMNETLHYIIDSFSHKLKCDLTAIILEEKDKFEPKAWKGGSAQFKKRFPLKIEKCSPDLLKKGLTLDRAKKSESCQFIKIMEEENITTWFTLPIGERDQCLGFCVFGFYHYVPMLPETEPSFLEFGKDVAVALTMLKNKEIEKKKIEGVEWFNKNLFLGSSIEEVVRKIVERAGKGTNARHASIYLYDESTHRFMFQSPAFGNLPPFYEVQGEKQLQRTFKNVEQVGEDTLTIPLIANYKTIGALHVAKGEDNIFSQEDYNYLELLSTHVSILIENTRLYNNEIEYKQRLQRFMDYHKKLVKQTVEGESFDDITYTLHDLVHHPMILFDTFLRPLSYIHCDEKKVKKVIQRLSSNQKVVQTNYRHGFWMNEKGKEKDLGVWPVVGGGDILGYLTLHIPKHEVTDLLEMTIEHALNIYAIQFVKQKLVMDTREQLKDSFFNDVLENQLEDEAKIIEYANLFHWKIFDPHRVAVLKIVFAESEKDSIIDHEERKAKMWRKIKESIPLFDQQILMNRKGEEFIFIVRSKGKQQNPRYWEDFYQYLKELVNSERNILHFALGIGSETNTLSDYHRSYLHGYQAAKLLTTNGFQKKGLAFFEDLGVYTLLNNIDDASTATLFIEKYLSTLIDYTKKNGPGLYETLRTYLYNNGNLTKTKDDLFIHRSTLKYRIAKIEDMLNIDLNDSEIRLNLMLADKLHDLHYKSNV